MLLDRVDIDRHGPLSRVELGPFSEQLNVVCGPEGSGKTAIARFIRDSLIRRNYPLGMMSSSSGRVVWADRNGKIHCRREQDGTRDGRRTIEFESRGDHQHRFDWLHDSWIKGIADSTDASRALESIRIPESIVDGIITDTAVTSVSRVVDACLRSGLTDPSLFASLPINSSRVSGMSPEVATQRESERLIRDELARIESELATCSYPHSQTDSTLARRRELEARLAFLESRRRMPMNGPSTPTASAELAGLHDRIWQLRVRHSELSRWLDHLRVDQNRVRYQEPLTASPYANNALSTAASLDWNAHRHLQVDAQIRERLVALDDQLIRWRRMLTELRGLRDTLVAQRSSLEQSLSFGAYPLTDDLLRRERMNHFLKSLDRRGAEADARLYAPSTITGHWPDDIDLRIESVIRHVDWLASHYDRAEAFDFSWYKTTPALHRGDEGSLLRSLQSIREELQDVRRRGFRFHPTSATQREVAEQNAKLIDLQHTERWIVASIESLLRHRESLIQDHQWAASVRYPSWLDDTYHHQPWSPWYTEHLSVEVARCTRDLERVASELDQCVSRAERLRMEMRSLPVLGYDTYLDPALEMQRIQADLAAMQTPSIDARHEWLLQRRAELRSQLGSPQPVRASALPLADEASQWLVRLSAGRLKRVDWNPSTFTTRNDGPANATSRPGLVTIDGREEANCPAIDRALASLAVRMASADLLGRTGRPVPLVIESHRELLRPLAASYGESGPVALPYTALPHTALPHTALPHDANNTVIAALHDFASLGRQVIVLTSDRVFADQVGRRGGFTQFIHGENIAHQHQPLWEPHFATEHYAGPYGDVYAAEGPRPVGTHPGTPLVNRYYDEPASFYAPMNAADVMPANAYSPTQVSPAFPSSMPPLPPAASVADINRRLDVIWQESQRPMRETPVRSDWHDGYYYSQSYTTTPQNVTSSASRPTEATNEPVKSPRQSPFFLTVDSPIDQAPSVDAVAASRLRALDVTHVNHLMQQDPNRLSDALGLAGVTAATIRRWQAECRLVCHVPQLRGFDARVLVGSGITDAADLAATDPNDLLDRVEAFSPPSGGNEFCLAEPVTSCLELRVGLPRQTFRRKTIRSSACVTTTRSMDASFANRSTIEMARTHSIAIAMSMNLWTITAKSFALGLGDAHARVHLGEPALATERVTAIAAHSTAAMATVPGTATDRAAAMVPAAESGTDRAAAADTETGHAVPVRPDHAVRLGRGPRVVLRSVPRVNTSESHAPTIANRAAMTATDVITTARGELMNRATENENAKVAVVKSVANDAPNEVLDRNPSSTTKLNCVSICSVKVRSSMRLRSAIAWRKSWKPSVSTP